MRNLTVALMAAGSLVLAAVAATGDDGWQKMTLTLPQGDVAAGREAFAALMCTTCHAVAGESELPQPVAQVPVPVLGPAQAKQSPSKLASSIVSPSHKVSDEVLMKTWGELSPMGDFSETMTVRQLVDLVAYLRSVEAE
jgi:mono/diheme cytochrome c family protein